MARTAVTSPNALHTAQARYFIDMAAEMSTEPITADPESVAWIILAMSKPANMEQWRASGAYRDAKETAAREREEAARAETIRQSAAATLLGIVDMAKKLNVKVETYASAMGINLEALTDAAGMGNASKAERDATADKA